MVNDRPTGATKLTHGFGLSGIEINTLEAKRISTRFLWPDGPTQPVLESNGIQVWAASLDSCPETFDQYWSTLSDDERARAGRFHFDRHRRRFVAGRGLLRAILSRYLEMGPADVKFEYGPYGKPVLSDGAAPSHLHFNLAHSEAVALIAISGAGQVGVDVEQVRQIPDMEELVRRFFSLRESEAFARLGADQQPVAFFNLWTRKEAWLKATGAGIAHLLNQVEVSFLPGQPAELLRLPGQFAGKARWTLKDLAPINGFTAAIAYTGIVKVLSCWRWAKTLLAEQKALPCT